MRVFPSFFAARQFVSADAESFLPQKKRIFSYKLNFVLADGGVFQNPHGANLETVTGNVPSTRLKK